MAYTKDGEKLVTEVVDIPIGRGVQEKQHKQLFQAPFLREGKNITVKKEGAVEKRDGLQAIASIPGPTKMGAIYEHPSGVLGYAGSPTYQGSTPLTTPSVGVISGTGSGTAGAVSSNRSGIYACNIVEDPVVRSDDAILHVQTAVYENKIITVWCTQENALTENNTFWDSQPFLNKCFYMIRERDTDAVITQPTELGFTNNPRYTHIAILNDATHGMVFTVVAAPDLNPITAWAQLQGASVRIESGVQVYGPQTITRAAPNAGQYYLVAFDMHAPVGNSVAHIIAQQQSGAVSPATAMLLTIEPNLTTTQDRALTASEEPLHSGAIFCVAGEGVFTAVSNQDGIAGARIGDGQVHFHKYSEAGLAPQWGTGQLVFGFTVRTDPNISTTAACTRLSIGYSDVSAATGTLTVWGSQFWNTSGYNKWETALDPDPNDSQAAFTPIRNSEYYSNSKSFVRTLWRQVTNCFTASPTPEFSTHDQPCVFLTTKAFQKSATDYPMIGVGASNGRPSAGKSIRQIENQEDAPAYYRYNAATSPTTITARTFVCCEDQESKHPVGLIVCPEYNYSSQVGHFEFLRPVAKFAHDLMVEAEDTFPLKWGRSIPYIWDTQTPTNNIESRWESPGLSSVWNTEVSGECLFAYKSRLTAGVERKIGFDRPGAAGAVLGVGYGGTYFTKPPNNAFGGEEVRLHLEDREIITTRDGASTYFSGGYLGFFDGVLNGESDAHSSPGRPFVELINYKDKVKGPEVLVAPGVYALDPGYNFPQEGLEDPNSAPSDPSNLSIAKFSKSWDYEFVLVYAILDEDGQWHRSAPSISREVNNLTTLGSQYYTEADAGNCVAVVRYLMPPPSAFMGLGNKTLYLEVYVKSQVRSTPEPDPDKHLIQDIGNYRLIDRFIPTLKTDLRQYQNLAAPTPHTTGSHYTPFINSTHFNMRSGFPFYGERVIYRPEYTASYAKSGETAASMGSYVDSGQMLDENLYTVGGVLENDPPPAFHSLVVSNKRMWGIPANDRSQVWFSKYLEKGKAPEWSAAFTLRLPRGADNLIALGQMDEKLVMFSRDDIFLAIGSGPNNLGRGGTLSGPTRVSSDVGCVNRRSVVSGSFGVMFQSAKGIYMLGRDTNVTYIGAEVEDQITSENIITSAVLYEDKNEVWFSLDTTGAGGLYKAVVYNYEAGAWFVHDSQDTSILYSVAATLWKNKYTTAGSLGLINMSTPGTVGDGAPGGLVPINSSFTTAWVKLAGIQGFQRVKRAFLLGERRGGRVKFGVQYNYDETTSTEKTWESAEFGASPLLSNDPLQVGIHIPRQKCQSIRFTFSDEANPQVDPATGGCLLSSITIKVGMKMGLFKMKAEAKK